MSAKAPNRIGLNAIDRYYLIPETDDLDAAYFPMTIGCGVELRESIRRSQIIEALRHVNTRFPQFRLGYRLDHRADCWRKVPEAELEQHFAAMAKQGAEDDLDALIGDAIRTNVTPMSLPLQISAHGRNLILKISHSFCDGRFAIKLMAHLIIGICDQTAYDALSDVPMRYSLPMWRVVWDRPRQGFKTLSKWLQTFNSSVQDYKGSGEKVNYTPVPIKSGTEMCTSCFLLSKDIMAALDRLRKSLALDVHISFNTLMQVLLAHRLFELGILPTDRAITYTQPIDLKRYLKNPEITYGGNLAGQIRRRLPARPEPDFRADCIDFQQWIDTQVNTCLPLATLPSEWLLALAGKRFYKKTNRDWLLQSIHTDPRYFVFSNLGNVDHDIESALPFIAPGTRLSISVSLMGGPPLVISLVIVKGQGHLSFIYNPLVLNSDQIEQIARVFSLEWLDQRIHKVNT